MYDLGDGNVLRRYRRNSQSAEQEAEVMRLAALAGVPVPTVHAAHGNEIRMDRVDTVTMADQLSEQPEQAAAFGVMLAELHASLDAVDMGGVDAGLVHGDLHPGNVIVGPTGPMIIDWTNHRIGPCALDVALTWLVLACFQPDDKRLRASLAPTREMLLQPSWRRPMAEHDDIDRVVRAQPAADDLCASVEPYRSAVRKRSR